MSKQLSDADLEEGCQDLEAIANSIARDTREVFGTFPTPDKIIRLADIVYTNTDVFINKYQPRRIGGNFACHRGCSWCCTEIVLATVPEILAIFRYIQTHFTGEEVEALVGRLKTYDANMSTKRNKTFTFVKEPCPLLVDNMCSIYLARPLECRGRNSDDENLCRMWSESPGDGGIVTHFAMQKMIARAAAKGLSVGYGDESGSTVHELNRCLKMLIDDPNLGSEILSGRATFPPVVHGEKPLIFNPDAYTISPPGITHPVLMEAMQRAQRGNAAGADELVMPGTSIASFIKMRLPTLCSSYEQILEARERIDSALDQLDSDSYNFMEVLPVLVDHTTAPLAYHGLSGKHLLGKMGKVFYEKIISKAYPHLCAPIEGTRKPGRFRVGYISGALVLNNGCRWALGWLRNHGPEFETYALNLSTQEDIGSKLFADAADHYYSLQGNIQRIAEFIRGLDLDALIITDIGYRPRDYIYYHMRLARVQCTGWGGPITSGIPNVDYYLSSDYMEPEDAQDEYTEKLVRLPRSGLCIPRPKTSFWQGEYKRPIDEFFPFMAQNLRKWTPQRDPLLKRIADRYGKPMKFVSLPEGPANDIFSQRMTKIGVEHEMLPFTLQQGYANYMRAASVSIDTPDWSGGNTTIEALSYGIPIVAWPGKFMRGRHSLAFLKIANAEGLIAKDEDDFVDLIFEAM
jgi:Fe-S-cluster containining protein